MKEPVFTAPEEAGTIHAMVVVGDYIYISDGKSVYSWYHPPKTIWQKIHDFFLKGKDWVYKTPPTKWL